MEWVEPDFGEIDEHGSRGVLLTELTRLSSAGEFRVHVAELGVPGLLGRHPGRLWQLFSVVRGQGWVSGADGVRHPIGAGQSVLWQPGESHESGTEDGMLVVMVQSSIRPIA